MKKYILFISALALLTGIVPVSAVGTEDVYSENCPPIAENMEIKTYRSVAVNGSVSAIDPEGEGVTFFIADTPKKGELEFGEAGDFTYTPDEGAKGKDKFTYYAVDTKGGKSDVATVTISVEKRRTEVWYSDLEGSGFHYPALKLAEQGIYVGESLGGEYFFSPNEPVTRGRFLAMCMKLCGTETIGGVIKTGYSDDDAIPMWTKPYAAAAVMTGVLDPTEKELRSEDAISLGEATVILNGAMNITDVYCEDGDEAVQAMANLKACRIVPDSADGDGTLTMGEAAEMLSEAYEVLERR